MASAVVPPISIPPPVFGPATERHFKKLVFLHVHEGTADQENIAKPSRFSVKLGYFILLFHQWFRGITHPYFVCLDTGFVVGSVVSYWYIKRWDLNISASQYNISFWAVNYVLMEIFQALKRFCGLTSRSFLQDTFCFLIPSMYIVFQLQDMPSAVWDLVGINFATTLAFIRLGCFFGGCCFGRNSRYGVFYPKHIFCTYTGLMRRFSCGDEPKAAVLPIQLFESLFCLATAGFLYYSYLNANKFILFLELYSAWRFASDWLRTSSARPRYINGLFSEAQLVSVGIQALFFYCNFIH